MGGPSLRPDLSALRAAITPRTRVILLNSPHNPTGACVDLAFMQRVVDFCREREMIVVHWGILDLAKSTLLNDT